jgi:hypothetical protein
VFQDGLFKMLSSVGHRVEGGVLNNK